jgi:hypothetical protein
VGNNSTYEKVRCEDLPDTQGAQPGDLLLGDSGSCIVLASSEWVGKAQTKASGLREVVAALP